MLPLRPLFTRVTAYHHSGIHLNGPHLGLSCLPGVIPAMCSMPWKMTHAAPAALWLRLHRLLMLIAVGVWSPATFLLGQDPAWSFAGLPGQRINAITHSANGDVLTLWAGTSTGLYSSLDEGLTWSIVPDPLLQVPIVQLIATDQTIHAASPAGLISSFDGGITWEQRYASNEASGVYAMSENGMGGLFLSVYDTSIVAATRTVVFSSSAGPDWVQSDVGIIGFARATSFATIEDQVYMIAGQGLISYDILYSWNPTTLTWDQASSFPPSIVVESILPINEQQWLATTSNGVFTSQNNGATWSPSGLFPNACDPVILAADGSLWVGTNATGVYRSNDTGTSWSPASQGLPVNPFQEGLVDPVLCLHQYPGGLIFLGTRDHGIYSYDTPTAVPSFLDAGVRVWPQPASTTLNLTGTHALSLTLLDSQGRSFTITRAALDLPFNIAHLPSGAYVTLLPRTDAAPFSTKLIVSH